MGIYKTTLQKSVKYSDTVAYNDIDIESVKIIIDNVNNRLIK